ncbi:MAG: endo-1,4-beta-xylanase Z [Bacteroidales bacterium]|nr:endo-1,4-beta-xylanase Z [Bacteroidales bacterium]
MKKIINIISAMTLCCFSVEASAQWQHTPTPNDTLKSVQRLNDGSVLFSIYAPNAKDVRVAGDCVPWVPGAVETNTLPNGVWTMKVAGVADGAYRYHFVVDGINVYDPKADDASETSAIATLTTTGNEFFALKDVPHGAISERIYFSSTLNTYRRMHVWTPAGYEKSSKALPVLYLIHGGGDTDNSWPGVGCAGLILDNLMAEGKIEPMVVVMPNGTIATKDMMGEVPLFASDMVKSIIPFIEANYNVLTDKDHRAMAGLSMGGMETMETCFNNVDLFSYVWVLSSSLAPGTDPHAEADRLGLKAKAEQINKSFKQLVFTQGGKEDIAYNNCKNTLKVLDEIGIKYEFSEAPGGHTWFTWRNNLYELAPRLFR